LLLARGHSVPGQRLVDAPYGSRPASSARNQIQQAVSALRRLGVPITRVDGGYLLAVTDEDVDAFTFESRLRQASVAAEAGRHGEAAALLREGLALWQGPPLTGLDSELAERTRTNLEESRIAALAECVNAELEMGRHTRLIGELRDLVARYPLHERWRRTGSRTRAAGCAWTCTARAVTRVSSRISGRARTRPAPTRTSPHADHPN
jgi:DNA-binding SARP family transcriptional activator